MKKNRGVKGFTLMELVAAAAIISLLAALSIPAYGSAVDLALAGTCKYNQRYLESLLSVFQAENSRNFADSEVGSLNETAIKLNGESLTNADNSLYQFTKITSPFECPAARYYKVGGDMNGQYVCDGYKVACATDNHRSHRSDGQEFSLDAPHSWSWGGGSKSWDHER